MGSKVGQQSISFERPPVLLSTANIVGPMEGEGLLSEHYDRILPDNINGYDSWEKCESAMLEWAITNSVNKLPGISLADIDFVLAGDLLNQLMATHFALRGVNRPFIGLYGACSTMIESTLLGSMIVDGGFAHKVIAATSSHHEASERQYRYPTELGVQRPMTTQWTVTGSGAVVLGRDGTGPRITGGTVGKVMDLGIKDVNAMGAAMAPAAADTLYTHLADTGRETDYYDMIYTGDLGAIGKALMIDLLQQKGLDITQNYEDCGLMIYRDTQDVHSGASGCASSAIVFTGAIYNMLLKQKLRKILLIGTGSLHSPTSSLQKESIPAIAHAVAVEI